MRLAEHIACMGKRRVAYRFGRETVREKGHLESLGIAMRIVLKWI
jgi:hypothetical protein